MGIQGLTKLIQSLDSNVKLEHLPYGSHLFIDGYGWIFFLLHSVDCQLRERGGGYEELRQLIRDEIHYLRDICRFELIVCFDGSCSQMKGDTNQKRQLQRDDQWIKLFGYCSRGIRLEESDIPNPVLCVEQAKALLIEMNIAMREADYEADQMIAKLCSECSFSGTPAYCYGNDRYLNRILLIV
jgi:5'-3' exonuclease